MINDRNSSTTWQQTSVDNPIRGASWLVIFLGKDENNARQKWPCFDGSTSGARAFCTLVKFVCQQMQKSPPLFYYDWSGENTEESILEGINRSFRGSHPLHRCNVRTGEDRCSTHIHHNSGQAQRAVGHVAVVFDTTDFLKPEDFISFTTYLKGHDIKIPYRNDRFRSVYPICSNEYPNIPSDPNHIECNDGSHSCIIELIAKITGYNRGEIYQLLINNIKDVIRGFALDEPLCLI